MTINIITERDKIRGARNEWLAQYRQYKDSETPAWAPRRTYGDIRRALASLNLETCSSADIDAALGAGGWGSIECDECKTSCAQLVRIGEEPDYEARWVDICVACLGAAQSVTGAIPPHYLRAVEEREGLIEALEAYEREREDMEDRAPTYPECIECNLGTGPHKRTCAHHKARAALAKALEP